MWGQPSKRWSSPMQVSRCSWTHPNYHQAKHIGKSFQRKWNDIHSDQTGRFPVQSSRGNTSLMVYYDIDANYIDAEPNQKPCWQRRWLSAYQKLWQRTNRGRKIKPNLHILDNEASEAFKSAIQAKLQSAIGTTWYSSKKPSWESHPNIQRPFHFAIACRSRPKFPNEPMGPFGAPR